MNPYELETLYKLPAPTPFAVRHKGLPDLHLTLGQLLSCLGTLLMVLKSCQGRQCTHPWELIHSKGNITSLKDALAAEFDAFYETQERVLLRNVRGATSPKVMERC
ncbi:hypothetical protein BJ170DRAFT_297544 [Xylariales sp. AK1849]|nr:hypothetical protein BJ170DRAFT_297544 [Xylariales sp. AK1849]